MNMNVLITSFILVFAIAFLLYYRYRIAKKNSKTSTQKDSVKEVKQLPQAASKSIIKSPVVETPISNRGRRASKVIICKECINEIANSKPEDTEEGEEPEVRHALVFDNWMPYAAHILQKHPQSTRVEWAIGCVKDEISKFHKENKELSSGLKILIELIQSNGTKPIVDVGIPYNQYEAKTFPEAIEANKQKITVADDWAERLGDIEKLGRENQEPSTELAKVDIRLNKNIEITDDLIDKSSKDYENKIKGIFK